MTKRVPLNSFTAEDGNPDDKRPRRGAHEFVVDQPSSSGLQLSNDLPSISSSSVLGTLSSPSSVLPTNGNFSLQNGSQGDLLSYRVQHNPSLTLAQSLGGSQQAMKCSICLWPIGSSRCYHGIHNLSTRSSLPTASH